MKKFDIIFGILRLPMDFCMGMLALFIAYFIRPYTDLIPGVQFPVTVNQLPDISYYFIFVFICTCFLVVVFVYNGLYSLQSSTRKSKELFTIIIASSAWLMGVIAYYFLIAHQLFFSRILLIHSYLLIIVLIFFGRMLLRIIRKLFYSLGYGRKRVLFVGFSPKLLPLYTYFSESDRYKLMGVIARKLQVQSNVCFLGDMNELETVLHRKKPDEIICDEETTLFEETQKIMSLCQEKHIDYRFIPAISKLNFSHLDIDVVAGTPLIKIEPTPLDGWGRVIKRVIDLIVSAFFLVLLSPLFLIVAIFIKIGSGGGPVFYKSIRVGQKGRKTFEMIKFCSMYKDADKMKKELLTESHRKGPLFKIKDDPRITRVGKWIRKTSIDELPQLWNVFKGQMSLVGPRAHLPEEVAKYKGHHYRVLAIKPGISGMAQVNGRSDLNFEDEVKFDTYYIENWSLFLDLWVLFRTIFVVFSGKGAD